MGEDNEVRLTTKKNRMGSVDTLNTDDNTDNTNSKDAKKGKKNKKETTEEKNEQKELLNEYKKMQGEMKRNISAIKLEKLEEILAKLENYGGAKSHKENLEALCDQNVNIQIKLKEILNEFWKSFKPLKCPNCDSSTIKLKKQGFIKIFQMPLS